MCLERMPTFTAKGIDFRLLNVFVFHEFSFPRMGLHPPAADQPTIIPATTSSSKFSDLYSPSPESPSACRGEASLLADRKAFLCSSQLWKNSNKGELIRKHHIPDTFAKRSLCWHKKNPAEADSRGIPS